MAWSRPSCSGTSPSARAAHTTDACGSNGKLYVFGGWDGSKMLNDLHIYHSETMTWVRPITTGNLPNIRAGHTMTSVGRKLFIFGGGDGNNYLNDLHILDTETMEWSQAYVTGTSPAARSRHTATLVGSQLFIFGGGDDSRVYNDIYVLDTETMSWSRPIVKGNPPVARWGHTTTLISEKKLLIFGGHDGIGSMLGDLNILDVETMSWSQLIPPAKNLDGQPNVGPSPRAGHTITYVGNDKLLLFGGGDGTRILNDVWFLDKNTLIWYNPLINGTAPVGRCAHTSTLTLGKLAIFGGGDGNRRFKDLYLLDIDQVFKNEESRKNNKLKKVIKPRKQPEKAKASEIKDITSFLSNLGMKKFVDKFINQEIDMDMLPFLNETHLEQLGVNTLGARIRILTAINQLKAQQETESEIKEDLIDLTLNLKEAVETLSASTLQLNLLLTQAQNRSNLNGQSSRVNGVHNSKLSSNHHKVIENDRKSPEVIKSIEATKSSENLK